MIDTQTRLLGRRTACLVCSAEESFGVRMDRRARPYLACRICNAKIFGKLDASGAARLLASVQVLASPEAQNAVSKVVAQWASAPSAVAPRLPEVPTATDSTLSGPPARPDLAGGTQ